MSILVTGGAGYIGSHVVSLLRSMGRRVVIVDDLVRGHQDCVPPDVPLLVADVGDAVLVPRFLRAHGVRSILHFASLMQVGESVTSPRLYWTRNLASTVGLLESALDAGIGEVVLSSTAAVYGEPRTVPLTEDHPTVPINPYGETKLAMERVLASYSRAYGMRYAALRYFNAAGADVDAGLGERHEPETHLIPIAIEAALGEREKLLVYGNDYPTPDGTCVRDYVHVADLALAHLAALEHLARGGESGAFNLGTGSGHSVEEVIRAVSAVSGRRVPVEYAPRRSGDPPALVASPKLAQARLGWRASRSLYDIVIDAWEWHSRERRGMLGAILSAS